MPQNNMSQDEPPDTTTRAEKRAARDAERAAKFNKRGVKRDRDGVESNELEKDFILRPAVEEPVVSTVQAEEGAVELSSRKAKKAQRDAERFKQGKKRKAETLDDGEEVKEKSGGSEENAVVTTTVEDGDAKLASAKKQKRQPKEPQAKRKPAKKATKDGETGTEDGEVGEAATQSSGKQRFIVFIGNLPYTTTDASLHTHFNSLRPFTLRHRTDPKTKKSKGFAFLEFEAFDRMKTCLKLYHHSYFDPESPEKSRLAGDGEPDPPQNPWNKKGKKEKGRRINVELTAGGGGAKDDRKEKIRVKNVRLEEQRQRRAELERKEKGKQDGKPVGAARRKGAPKAAEEPAAVEGAGAEGMHPARLAMMSR